MNVKETVAMIFMALAFVLGIIFGRTVHAENKQLTVKSVQSFLSPPLYRIAILDTGYDRLFAEYPLKLCNKGSYDYANQTATVGSATERHGTYVASTIAAGLENVNYCAVIFQVFGKNDEMTTENVVDALIRARKLGVIAVNLSFRSGFYEYIEYKTLKSLSDQGIMLFVAAGNEARDLNLECDVYPACYKVKNIVVVGALTADADVKASYSNYGAKVNRWYPGIYHSREVYARGTSFAAPQALAYYVRWLSEQAVLRPAPKSK